MAALSYRLRRPREAGTATRRSSLRFPPMPMLTSAKAPIVVVGAGHVGLVTAVGIAAKREVRLVDKQSESRGLHRPLLEGAAEG
jgi:hypothetical protein